MKPMRGSSGFFSAAAAAASLALLRVMPAHCC